MSITTQLSKALDTQPASPGDLQRFNHDINQRYEILSKAKKGAGWNPVRKWLSKRQRKRSPKVGRDPRTGDLVYKTVASARGPEGEWHRPGSVFKADGYVRTIYDLMDLNYNFFPQAMGKGEMFAKADDPLLSTTTGVHNDVYGSDVFALLNSEQNIFGILETRPWTKSGERIITEFAEGGTSVSGTGGVGENASLPDTTKPTFDTFETQPRTVVHTFDVSQVEQLLAATDDDAISDDPFALLRQYFGEGLPDQQTGGGEHPKQINVQLITDADGGMGSNDFRSLDALISDGSESSVYSNPDDNDVYGFDRSSNEFESNVLHDGGSTRVFHLDLIDDALTDIKEASDMNPQQNPDDFVIITGHDTYQRIEDEMGGKERIETVRVQQSVNGIQTEPGNDVGVAVSTYKGIPIVEAVDVPQDTLSRIYIVNLSTLWLKMLLPTQFYSTGTEVGEGPFPLGRLGNEGAFVTIGELTMKNPKPHAKIRDLE